MSFFSALFGVCRGPEVFHRLRKQPGWRVFFHLLLLTLLCGIAIGVGEYFMLKYRWSATEAGFNEIFGSGVTIGKQGIAPEISPEISRRQELPYNGLLIYVSPKGPEKYPDETLRDRNFILLWSSGCFGLALRNQQDQWLFQQQMPSGSVAFVPEALSYEDFREKLDKACRLPVSDEWKLDEAVGNHQSTRQIFHLLRSWLSVFNALIYFFKALTTVIFCTLVFSCVSFLVRARYGLGFGELWKTAVYAAFPAVIVVSAFPALQLPLVRYYDTLLVTGWLIYDLIVLRHLMKYPDEPEEENDHGQQY